MQEKDKVKEKIINELERLTNRHTEVVKHSLSTRGVEAGEVDPLAEYSEFILREGTYKEQGHLIEGIKTTFAIRNRDIIPMDKK